MKIIFATGNAHKLSEAQNVIGEGFELIMPVQVGIKEEIPENGDTLEENSYEKAIYIWNQRHECCFADDTGLEVEVLNGAPGVYTARYCSLPSLYSTWDNSHDFSDTTEANMQKLLMEMEAATKRLAEKGLAETNPSARDLAAKNPAGKNMAETIPAAKSMEEKNPAAKGDEIQNRKARFRTVVTLVKEGEIHKFEGVLNGRIATERSGHEGFGYDPIFIPDGYNCTLAELSMEEKNAISHRGKAMRALADFLNKNA